MYPSDKLIGMISLYMLLSQDTVLDIITDEFLKFSSLNVRTVGLFTDYV